jgi:hypothetical protein
MPVPVRATLTTTTVTHPYNTVVPASYVFALNDGTTTPIVVPYTTTPPITALFPAVPEGTWTGTCRMRLPNGTFTGPTATGQVIVPADIALQEPAELALAVA